MMPGDGGAYLRIEHADMLMASARIRFAAIPDGAHV
jgi:hypothetical protein